MIWSSKYVIYRCADFDGVLTEIAGSKPAEGMECLSLVCCVRSGPCDGLITRPGESY